MVKSETTLEKNMRKKTLIDYMSPAQKSAMYINGKQLPTWHSICTEKTGVARPGKTARDRANRMRRLINE
jgi:hypothetical protein